jgi:hypothetical protein
MSDGQERVLSEPEIRLPPDHPEMVAVLERFPPVEFERGQTLIRNTFRQRVPAEPALGYVFEGLVRGQWNRSSIAPKLRATAVIAGDRRWIGADAFKFGENIFKYVALTRTVASILPLAYVKQEASRRVLLDALHSVSLHWCTAASVLSLGGDTLYRRTLLLLYDMSRLHPRPEIEVRQADVADLLGVARQTLQPVLKTLERQNLITLGYGEISIGEAADLFAALRIEGSTGPGAGPARGAIHRAG